MKKDKLFLPKKLADEKIALLINKIIDFTFFGEKLTFYLSHALFSSFDVDAGTKLLLKTIAKKINFGSMVKVKDIGAGTGIIGICLKKRFPHIEVTFTDRDMLALDFTKINCELNNINDYNISGELGIECTAEEYDFIASNIPAKMGDKGFDDLLKKMLSSLKPMGICAIVVIKPLEEKIRAMLNGNNAHICFEEEGNAHWVCHFKASPDYAKTQAANVLEPYLRGNLIFDFLGHSCKLRTVFNLPDFDTLGYQSELLLKLIEKENIGGICLFWNPLQGHIPVIAGRMFSGKITRYILASRDLLQLRISQDNLEANGISHDSISIYHVSFISDVNEPVHNCFILPDIIPMADSYAVVLKDLQASNIYISDKSSNIFRLLDSHQSCRCVKKIKKNGFTGISLVE